MNLFRTELGLEIEKSLKENTENWIFDFDGTNKIWAEFKGFYVSLEYLSSVSYAISLQRYKNKLAKLSFFDERAIKETLESIKKTREKDLESQVLEILKK